MDKDRKTVNKVNVEIFGENYVVKGEESPEYIEMLAAYIDKRMKLIQQRNPHLSTAKIAVLTALNLADELNKLQDDYDKLLKMVEEERKNRMGEKND